MAYNKIFQYEKSLKLIQENKNHIFEEIKQEFSESEKETLEYYKEYLIKFKNFAISKLKSAHLNLEEVTNERDEFRDYLEALLKVFF